MVSAVLESVEVAPLPVTDGTRPAGEVVIARLAAGAARRKALAVTVQQRGRDRLASANAPEAEPTQGSIRGSSACMPMRRCADACSCASVRRSRVRAPQAEYGGEPSPVCHPGVYALSNSKIIEPGVIGGNGGDGGRLGGGSAAPGGTGVAQMVKPSLHTNPSSSRRPSATAAAGQGQVAGGSSNKRRQGRGSWRVGGRPAAASGGRSRQQPGRRGKGSSPFDPRCYRWTDLSERHVMVAPRVTSTFLGPRRPVYVSAPPAPAMVR